MIHDVVNGVQTRVDIGCETHGVICPAPLIHLLECQHLIQGQLRRRLYNLFWVKSVIQYLVHEDILGWDSHNHGVFFHQRRFYMVAPVYIIHASFPLIRIKSREPDSPVKILGKDWMNSLTYSRHLGNRTSRCNGPSLDGYWNPQLMSILNSCFLNLFCPLPEPVFKNLWGTILDPSHSQSRRNTKVTNTNTAIPKQHLRLFLIIDVSKGGSDKEPSHIHVGFMNLPTVPRSIKRG